MHLRILPWSQIVPHALPRYKMQVELKRTRLNEGWQFKQTTSLGEGAASSSYLPVSQFPTVAHIDLLHHGLIKDPYIDCNELGTLWFVLLTHLPSSLLIQFLSSSQWALKLT